MVTGHTAYLQEGSHGDSGGRKGSTSLGLSFPMPRPPSSMSATFLSVSGWFTLFQVQAAHHCIIESGFLVSRRKTLPPQCAAASSVSQRVPFPREIGEESIWQSPLAPHHPG